MDLHSYAGTMLHGWGDDQNQTTHPEQRFTNPAFDGKRGVRDTAYMEYIEPDDLAEMRAVAGRVADAMKGARGRTYTPAQSVELLGWYPTSGASDDYAHSRHITDPALGKALGFTMEFNFNGEGFWGPADPAVLEKTKLEVVPGLIEFCLTAMPPRLPPDEPGTHIRVRVGVNGGGVFSEVSGLVITLPNGRQVALPPIRIYIFGPGPVRPQDPHRDRFVRVFAELASLVHDEPARRALEQVTADVLELTGPQSPLR